MTIIWECYGCGCPIAALTEGFNTRCPNCGSREIHLTEEAKKEAGRD